MENNSVTEIVENLIKDKTIKPSERESISNILSQAINSVPNDQIATFKKRVEILAESSSQAIFSNLGVNLGVLQGVVDNIVKETQNLQTIEDKQPITPSQDLENKSEQPNENNFAETILPEGSPEYIREYNENIEFLRNLNKIYGLDDAPDVQNTQFTCPDSQVAQEVEEELLQEDSKGMIDVQRLNRTFYHYCSLGFTEEIAKEKACADLSITPEQLQENNMISYLVFNHKQSVQNRIKEISEQTGRILTEEELYREDPKYAPQNNTFLKYFLPSEQYKDFCSNEKDFFHNLILNRKLTMLEKSVKKLEKKLDAIDTEINEFSHEAPEDTLRLLLDRFEAENNLAIQKQDFINAVSPNSPATPLLKNAALDYLTSEKTVSEIYYELQEKYPQEKIYFKDILYQIKETISPVEIKDWSLIEQNEENIHRKVLTRQAYDKCKDNLSQDKLNKANSTIDKFIRSQQVNVSKLKTHYRKNLGLEPLSTDDVNHDLSESELQKQIIQKLHRKIIENKINGDKTSVALEKACQSLNISSSDLEPNGSLHESISDFFKDTVHNFAIHSANHKESYIINNSPILNPNENILMRRFLSEAEKKEFVESQKEYTTTDLERLQKNQKDLLDNSSIIIGQYRAKNIVPTQELIKESLKKIDRERQYSETTYSINKISMPNYQASALVQEAAKEYFTSGQSVSDIYKTKKTNPQTNNICFEDILREVTRIAKENISNPSYIDILQKQERNIHKSNAIIDAYKVTVQNLRDSGANEPDKETELLFNMQKCFDANSKSITQTDAIKNYLVKTKQIYGPESTHSSEELTPAQKTDKTQESATPSRENVHISEESTSQSHPEPIKSQAVQNAELLKNLVENFNLDTDDISQDSNLIKELSEQSIEQPHQVHSSNAIPSNEKSQDNEQEK